MTNVKRLLAIVTMAVAITLTSALSQTRNYEPHLRAKIAHSVAKGERRARERQARPREVCSNCSRPPILCVCKVLPKEVIATSTNILILQHPNEFRKRNLSTVPLMRLVLKNVEVRVGYSFELQDLASVMDALECGRTPLLLYPGPDAISLDDAGNDSSQETSVSIRSDTVKEQYQPGHLLILIDGTWAEAKRIIRESPSLLRHCQQVQFEAESSSLYDAVRKEPDGHCLSTLEACAKALVLLESSAQNAANHLHSVLQSHVDAHVMNAETLEPRNVGVAIQRSYEKNKRRREIERTMFDGVNVLAKVDKPAQPIRRPLDDGTVLRSLTALDAAIVDSWWEYRSAKSHSLVSRRIDIDGGVACLGIEVDGNLAACILRYDGGALGMLHVKEECRRRGYGAILLQEATSALEERGEECVAFILDGNTASEDLFSKLGWERADLHIKMQTGNRRSKRKWVKR